jgi:hypothetical protein
MCESCLSLFASRVPGYYGTALILTSAMTVASPPPSIISQGEAVIEEKL